MIAGSPTQLVTQSGVLQHSVHRHSFIAVILLAPPPVEVVSVRINMLVGVAVRGQCAAPPLLVPAAARRGGRVSALRRVEPARKRNDRK